VGSNFDFLEQRSTVSLSGYYTVYRNQQLSLVQVTASGVAEDIFTVEKSIIKGVELETQERPITGLELGLGIGAQDAKIKEFGNSLTGSSFSPAAYVGNNVPLQSRYTVNASTQYTRALVDDVQGFIRTDVSCKGTLYWYADNQISRPPFHVVNAKVGVRRESWEANIFGSNIFNKTYDALYFDSKFVGARADSTSRIWPTTGVSVSRERIVLDGPRINGTRH